MAKNVDFLITQIIPFSIIPYFALMLSVVIYIIYKKYQVIVKIRNVPFSTIFQIDLNKVKANLEIKLLIYNFLLVLASIEMVSNLLWAFSQIYEYWISTKLSSIIVMRLSNSCNITDPNFTFLFTSPVALKLFSNSSVILISIIPTMLCLFLIVLRRVFLNLPYRHWIQGYTLFILFRIIALTSLSHFKQTYYLRSVFYVPFGILDLCIYLRTCRSFYLLLKGRKIEALWHSSRRDYIEKSQVLNRYLLAQIIMIPCMCLLLIQSLFGLITNFLKVITYNPCVISFISYGLSPTFILPSSVKIYLQTIIPILFIIDKVMSGLVELLLILGYLFACGRILMQLLRRRKIYNNANRLIVEPLMKKYREDLENYQRVRERPPFIQACRNL